MLTLTIAGTELYDEATETFVEGIGDVELELEHSLLSVSKWESKYQKPFLSSEKKSLDEILYYVESMIVTPNYPNDIAERLSQSDMVKINDYIESSESATTFGIMPERRGRGEVITSELIYYWMVAFQIPFECEFWHLNRLFSLIRICNIKNAPPKKMGRSEVAKTYQEINAQRKAQLGTSG